MPTNVKNFTIDLEKFNQRIREELVIFQKEITVSLYREIIILSPVWSGQFRASNVIAINSRDSSVSLNASAQEVRWPEPPSSILPARDDQYILAALAPLKPFQVVNISNSISYAGSIEAGSSSMAPAGVYLIAASKIAVRFRKGKRIKI